MAGDLKSGIQFLKPSEKIIKIINQMIAIVLEKMLQRFGHVAAECKENKSCGKCSGEHEYEKCEERATLKCFNCGGEHSSAHKGCNVRKRAAETQRVKVTLRVR